MIDKYICKDYDGNIFISFERNIGEKELKTKIEFTHCLAVVKIGNDYLLGWNKWRNRYEIFGGCVDNNESPRDCINRECFEELGIVNGNFTYLGAMKFKMMPDYFSNNERVEYGGLYGITLDDVTLDVINEKINDKDEILNLALYSKIKDKEPIAVIDEKLLEYY